MSDKPVTLPDIFLSIGSNIEPEKNLQAAVDRLRDRFSVHAISSVYQSPPFGFEDQPDFLDIVVLVTSPLIPVAFKNGLDSIEKSLGRDRDSQENKYGPLTLDIDILLWGDTAFSFGKKPWRVPNDGIVKYAAVAIPLAELAPDVVHPTENVTIREIAERFDDGDKIKKTDIVIT